MFLTQALIAQTTGKIIGQVKDKATKQPIAGANVIVLGTQRGASSDLNGDFVILNMPPGLYDIEIQMIGYKKLKLEGIQVSVNRTAYINAELEEAVLEGEVVVVTADRVSIKKDQTSSIRNITSDDIQALPVDNINQIVNMQPGVVGSHFRGGRSNEVNYMVDGILVSESFYHEDQTVQVNPDAVEEVEVITGTFNAEYGAAMSGVVNVITKEGSNKFRVSGSIHGGNYLTSHTDKFIGLETTDFNRIGDYSLNISGPIFSEKLSYITDFRYYYDDGHLNGIRRFKVDDYSDFSHYPDEWISEANGDSAYIPMDTQKRISFLGKFILTPTISNNQTHTHKKN
ncbi:MAG: carboxypeptidase-like regulatory domain-containing protein, partial [Prolixibacteraceae bacterium]|nr:carboxypeptidase-like regulatory domain-containing protein [Prolixibacteraceae bacterium]